MDRIEEVQFVIEPLDRRKHGRAGFSCGSEELDRYLKQQASQDVEKRVAAVMVLTFDGATIAGYYTLSQYAINSGDLPQELLSRLKAPRYPELPVTLLGRLARDLSFRGQNVGRLLVMGALKSSLDHSRDIASLGVVVDAKDDQAREFYMRFGFVVFPERRNRLFLPMQTVAEMFSR